MGGHFGVGLGGGLELIVVHAVMVEAARRQDVAVDRIAFVDALRWLQYSTRGVMSCRPAIMMVTADGVPAEE
jgi:hypothetical protein